jgi:hypothetical protein
MLTPSTEEIQRKLNLVGEDIWRCQGPDLDFNDVLQTASQLVAQLKIQKMLHLTVELLRNQSSDDFLPNQRAKRVTHFIKFVFEPTKRGDKRHEQFRKLNCNALKLCGLSYRVKDIIEMPENQFNLLITNLEDFAHRRHLSEYLYRLEIDKAVSCKFDPEDKAVFEEFMKGMCSIIASKILGLTE